MAGVAGIMALCALLLLGPQLWFPPAAALAPLFIGFAIWGTWSLLREQRINDTLAARVEHQAWHHSATDLPNQYALEHHLRELDRHAVLRARAGVVDEDVVVVGDVAKFDRLGRPGVQVAGHRAEVEEDGRHHEVVGRGLADPAVDDFRPLRQRAVPVGRHAAARAGRESGRDQVVDDPLRQGGEIGARVVRILGEGQGSTQGRSLDADPARSSAQLVQARVALQGVDVELYDAGTDAYITSVVTDASGVFSFTIYSMLSAWLAKLISMTLEG